MCWTPDDGFTVRMTAGGQATKRYVSSNRGVDDVVGTTLYLRRGV
jgi:hypothetical protein